jgi:hypothetical protein
VHVIVFVRVGQESREGWGECPIEQRERNIDEKEERERAASAAWCPGICNQGNTSERHQGRRVMERLGLDMCWCG